MYNVLNKLVGGVFFEYRKLPHGEEWIGVIGLYMGGVLNKAEYAVFSK